MTTSLDRLWRGALLPVAAIAALEIYFLLAPPLGDSLVAPSQMAAAFADLVFDGTLFRTTYQTIVSAMSGAMIGIMIGLLLGVPMGLYPVFGSALNLTVEFARPIPSIALIPIGMLIFGLGFALEISVVAFAAIWPTLILSRAAIAGIEPRLLEVSRTLQMSAMATARKIVIPAITPNIFVALRLSVTVSLIVAITVEIAANPIGLGAEMMLAQQTIRPARMYALLMWVASLGWVVNFAMVKLETRMFPGHIFGEPVDA